MHTKINPRIISTNIEVLLYDNHESEFDSEIQGIIERNYKLHDDIIVGLYWDQKSCTSNR